MQCVGFFRLLLSAFRQNILTVHSLSCLSRLSLGGPRDLLFLSLCPCDPVILKAHRGRPARLPAEPGVLSYPASEKEGSPGTTPFPCLLSQRSGLGGTCLSHRVNGWQRWQRWVETPLPWPCVLLLAGASGSLSVAGIAYPG